MSTSVSELTIKKRNSYTLKFTVRDQNDEVVDLSTLTNAVYTIASDECAGTVYIQKTIGDGITITDAENGCLEVRLVSTDTRSLPAKDLYNELHIRNMGSDQTVYSGTLKVERAIAREIS